MKVHFVVHEAFESPGAYEAWVEARGYEASYSRVYESSAFPDVDNIDLLVVLGGPQSPATTREECPHFDAAAECALIAKAVMAQKAVVGVCLGANCSVRPWAPGSLTARERDRQVPISLTEAGLGNDKVAHFGDILEVGHWHNDMPGLTENAKVLAYSEGCPRQIIEYARWCMAFNAIWSSPSMSSSGLSPRPRANSRRRPSAVSSSNRQPFVAMTMGK
ncbi:glutamine amidotransferase [Pseudomonas sp. PCH446]